MDICGRAVHYEEFKERAEKFWKLVADGDCTKEELFKEYSELAYEASELVLHGESVDAVFMKEHPEEHEAFFDEVASEMFRRRELYANAREMDDDGLGDIYMEE